MKKMPKHYHLDWTVVRDNPARFENLVACHLQKWVHYEQDTAGRDLDLRYFRDPQRREVDFVVLEGCQPLLLVECKWDDAPVDPMLRSLRQRYPECEAWQIAARGRKDYVAEDRIRVAPAIVFLPRLV